MPFNQDTYKDYVIYSVFQPIISLSHSVVMAYQALLRIKTKDGAEIPPLSLFSTEKAEDLKKLERKSLTLHVSNFKNLIDTCPELYKDKYLCLHLSPKLIATGASRDRFLFNLIKEYDIEPDKVIIQVLDTTSSTFDDLKKAVEFYKSQGFLIELDNFGAGHSNLNRIVDLKPDFVSLSYKLIAKAKENKEARAMLPSLIYLIHENNAYAIFEGIETEEDMLMAMECDSDMVQGHYYAKPSICFLPDENHKIQEQMKSVWDSFSLQIIKSKRDHKSLIKPYLDQLMISVKSFRIGVNLEASLYKLFKEKHMVCAYLLNVQGEQISNTINNPNRPLLPGRVLLPSGIGANWSRRHYYKKAVANFGEPQVSQGYFSAQTGTHCITLSLGFIKDEQRFVMCIDIDAESLYKEEVHYAEEY